MSKKYALIIGNTEYIDSGLAQLTAPGKDTEDFARILRDKDLCAFDEVRIVLNQLSSSVVESIDEFFDQRKPDDMLVLYFSGHGVRDEFGSLYLAVRNTIRSRLRSTAIRTDYIREAMDQSRSKRQILILDCCNSGAFPQGTKAELGGPMGMTRAFQGYGRFVLTASDATQFAWEGNKVIGQTENSLFTHFLVKGLEGEADNDGDGSITVDELYDYAYDQISRVTPKQTPTKSASKQEGEIVLRQITRLEQIKPVALPDELIEAIEDSRTFVREGAIRELEKVLKSKNLGLARSARQALERIEREDDSRRVSQAATQALESTRQAEKVTLKKAEEERLASEKAETGHPAPLEDEEERFARVKAEAESIQKERQRSQPIPTEQAKEAPSASGTLAKLQTMIAPPFLYLGLAVVLLIGLAWLGRSYSLRNMDPRTTPAPSQTEKQTVGVNAPLGGTLPATETIPVASPPKTITISPSPVSTASVVTSVSVTTSRAYLYKGPALEHGLVVQKPYLQGEPFTVLARNPSGLWLFGETTDGNQGWLYFEWVDLEIDPLSIPTASFIPTSPPAATRKPKGPGTGAETPPTPTAFIG